MSRARETYVKHLVRSVPGTSGSCRAAIMCSMIPHFTSEGLLLRGTYETSLAEVRAKLGWTSRRRRLMEGVEQALSLMGSCGVERVYFGGTFVTEVDRPHKIQGCYDLRAAATADDLLRLDPVHPPSPWHRQESLERFGAEFYPAALKARGSGHPFLELFRWGLYVPGPERGVLLIELQRAGSE